MLGYTLHRCATFESSCTSGSQKRLCTLGEKPPWNPAWLLQHLQAQSDLNCLKTQEDWCRNAKPPPSASYSKSFPGFRWWLKSDSIKITVIIKKKKVFLFTSLFIYDKITPLSRYQAGKWRYLWAGAEQKQQDPKENKTAAPDPCAVCLLQNNKFHGYQVNCSRQTRSFKTTSSACRQWGRHCSTPQLRAISLAAHTDYELGNYVAPGHCQEIRFSRRNWSPVSNPGCWQTSVFQASLPGSRQTQYGCLAAPQHSYLEGRQLKCDEAPNRRDAKGCLQGARWFKFPEESLWHWKIFRISEHSKKKS